jgi:integrase
MVRSKRSTTVDTWNKRQALPCGKEFMDTLSNGCYLIYSRPLNGASGIWKAQWYDPETRRKKRGKIGAADDLLVADGMRVLSYLQACEKAEAWFEACQRTATLEAGGEVPHKGPYTVADAWRDYLADAERRGVHGIRIMNQTADAHILPALGEIEVDKLTIKKVRDWHKALAGIGRRRTGAPRKEGQEVEHLALPETEDGKRARKDTANRILTNLKAALNFAKADKGIGRGVDWREVKPFKNVGRSRVRFLNVDEQQRLVNACAPDFRALVQGALFTGGRYGELARVLVRDFSPEGGTLFVEFGKAKEGYKSRHIVLTKEAREWFASHVAGRSPNALMWQRSAPVKRRGRAEALKDFDGWASYDEDTVMEEAVEAAGIGTLTFYELRHTYASALVNKGVPLSFVAEQLGHADIRMVQRHYGHLCPSAKADSIRLLAPVLGIGGDLVVQPLEIKKG